MLKEDWIRLTRYVVGECTPQESDDVERWLAGDPKRKATLEELQAAWALLEPRTNGNGQVGDAVDFDASWTTRAGAQWSRLKRRLGDSNGEHNE